MTEDIPSILLYSKSVLAYSLRSLELQLATFDNVSTAILQRNLI